MDMELRSVKNTLRFPLLALTSTWATFMTAIYIGIRNPQIRYSDQGRAIYPDPYVQLQTYVFLLGISVFALVAL